MAAGPLLHYSLSALGPVLIEELAISRTELGSFATVTFLAAASTAWLGGRFVDRQPDRRVILILYGLAASSLGLAAALRDFRGLLMAAALSGLAQALSNPVTNAMIATRPSQHRGILVGFKQSGVQLAQLVAGLLLPTVAAAVGWPGALVAAATLLLLALPATLRVAGRTRWASGLSEPSALGGVDRGFASALAVYSFLTGAAMQATNAYLPLYAYEALELDPTTAGLTAAVVGGVGLVSRPVWGRVAEGTTRLPRLLCFMALLSAGGSALILSASRSPSAWALWLGSAVHGAIAVAATVVVTVALLRTTVAEQVGRSTGLVGLGIFLGFSVGPIGFGWLSDRVSSYVGGWTFTICAHGLAATWIFVYGRWRSSDAGECERVV
jgi:MFS family permease